MKGYNGLHATFVIYDDEPSQIHARFGECACADIFLLANEPRDLQKAQLNHGA